jgi:hypothetical protein
VYRDDEPPPRSTTRSLAPAAGLFVALLLILTALAIVQPSLHHGSGFSLSDPAPRDGGLAIKQRSSPIREALSTSSAPAPAAAGPSSPTELRGAGPAASRVIQAGSPARGAVDDDHGLQPAEEQRALATTPAPKPAGRGDATVTSVPPTTPATEAVATAVATPVPPTAVSDPAPDPDPTAVPPDPTATPGLVDTLLDLLDPGP